MALLKKPSKTTKKSVADPSDAYHSLVSLWKKSRAVLQGQANVKAHDDMLDKTYQNLLLPFSPSMSQQQYDFFRSEAELPGLTSQYARLLISSLLRKQSQLELPESLPLAEETKDWIENNFTLDGRSLFNFMDQALWEELQTSRAWVYVDHPKISDDDYDSMSFEERMMINPYPVLIKAESVINYQTKVHPITRQKTLTRFITRYVEEDYSESPWHPDYVDMVCDHYLDESGKLVLDYYRKKSSAENVDVLNGTISREYFENINSGFEKIDTVLPQIHGTRLNRIPAWALNGHVDAVEPILMPLIDREIALYNKVSRRNHLLYGAATYTPIVSSDMSDDEFEDIVNAGLGTWLRVRAGESINVLETPTAALSDMDRAIESTIEEMSRMGIRMLSPEQAASGVALEIRNASQTAQLGTLNAKVSQTMQQVITFMLNWKYNTNYDGNDLIFSLSSDFSPMVGGEGNMRLVSEWYQSGLISRDTWVNIAKFNDFLPADYDDETAVQAIMTDPLTQQTPDDSVQIEE